MRKITNTCLKLKVICTELPGTRFEDPYGHDSEIKEPVYLGIQYGKEVIDQVPADRREVVFYPEFRVGEKPDGSPIFWVLCAGQARGSLFLFILGCGARFGGF